MVLGLSVKLGYEQLQCLVQAVLISPLGRGNESDNQRCQNGVCCPSYPARSKGPWKAVFLPYQHPHCSPVWASSGIQWRNGRISIVRRPELLANQVPPLWLWESQKPELMCALEGWKLGSHEHCPMTQNMLWLLAVTWECPWEGKQSFANCSVIFNVFKLTMGTCAVSHLRFWKTIPIWVLCFYHTQKMLFRPGGSVQMEEVPQHLHPLAELLPPRDQAGGFAEFCGKSCLKQF